MEAHHIRYTCVYKNVYSHAHMPKPPRTTRFCKACQQMLSVDRFCPNETSAYCREHFNARMRASRKRDSYTDKRRRAISGLRHKIWLDKQIFNQSDMSISYQDIRELLTDDQVDMYLQLAIVPDVPTMPLTKSNAVVIGNKHRKFVLGIWKNSCDPVKYRHFLHEHQFVDYTSIDYINSKT